ncbi:MAG: YciI family protein [Saprospiraceae bacterium]|nr:YciI family protein [Saprospiraceae bacterium]
MRFYFSKKEKKHLKEMYQKNAIPSYLYHNIVSKLKSTGYIMSKGGSSGLIFVKRGMILLVAILIFFTGYYTASKNQHKAMKTNRNNYMLIVHNDDIPPADPHLQAKEYGKWLTEMKTVRIASGEQLRENGWILSALAGLQIREVPSFKGKEGIGGYFIFEADNKEEALQIAQTCPHLKYKGTIELRELY